MARNLTTEEKKELKSWAKVNNIDLSYNKALSFGNGFWIGTEISDLKAAIMNLEDKQNFKTNARIAVGSNNLSFDADCSILGNENGKMLIGFEDKEVFVKFSSLQYVNGYLAVPKSLFK